MRTHILAVAALLVCGQCASSSEIREKAGESAEDAIFRELAAAIPNSTERFRSAKLELEYCRQHCQRGPLFGAGPERKRVKTADGKDAEVVLMNAPAWSMPGSDFSMAFLLVDGRVVDVASCWTYNRIASQTLQLEDVDGDGHVDLAFRASDGFWGLNDKRQHGFPNDKRKWLYAYAITRKGFESLFPATERACRPKVTIDEAGHAVRLEVKGLPDVLPQYRMVECELILTNVGKADLPLAPQPFFSLSVDGGYWMSYGKDGFQKRDRLKSGESVHQPINLYVSGDNWNGTMLWKYEPPKAGADKFGW